MRDFDQLFKLRTCSARCDGSLRFLHAVAEVRRWSGSTDSAGHANDAAALMRALWAFDKAVQVAIDYQRSHPDTLVLVGYSALSSAEADTLLAGVVAMEAALAG